MYNTRLSIIIIARIFMHITVVLYVIILQYTQIYCNCSVAVAPNSVHLNMAMYYLTVGNERWHHNQSVYFCEIRFQGKNRESR